MPQITVKLGDDVIQNMTFDKDIVNVGRSRDNDITLDNLAVSRSHCRIRKIDEKFILTDLNSANGTYVNGVKITKTQVMDEDVISIGKHKLVFQMKEMKQEEEIGDAFGADRTMIVENTTEGRLTLTKGKNKGQEYKVSKYETTIGRATDNDIVLNDWFVSKNHAKIIRQGNSYVIKDLGSWKGTYLNEKQIKEAQPLRERDEIRFGSTRFRFSIFDEKKQLQIEGRKPQELGYSGPDVGSIPAEPPPLSDEQPINATPDPDGNESLATSQFEALEPRDSSEYLSAVEIPPPLDASPPDSDIDFDRLPDPIDENAVTGSGFLASDAEDRIDKVFEAQEDPTPEPDAKPLVDSGVAWVDYSVDDIDPEPAPAVASAPADASPQAAAAAASAGSSSVAAAPSANGGAAPAGADGDEPLDKQVAMWERALKNKSPVVRKHAAKMLKKLTGKTYDS
jgi:pSer/pThr/pTyr-binding forkhead associated (FHA) protein